MKMIDLILGKKHGRAHSKEELEYVVKGTTDGSIPDYQLASWLMAVCWKGMTDEETAWLTDAMTRSGEVLDLSEIGPVVGDKHSTGGVGDKTTMVFVPLLAACGLPMAKLSGRGLGHTGGTIDKLEAIPGFQTDIPVKQFIQQVKKIGMAIAGQTQDLAPADGRLYALRDVTGTIDSIPLICGSIMSKKLAAGANLIILDVKCGKGAFMDTEEKATVLAQAMAQVGKTLNRPVTSVVTDMEQPLGNAVGHTTEVIEAIETLKGNGPDDLKEICLSLGSLALCKANMAADDAAARNLLEQKIKDGSALKAFGTLIEAQKGDSNVLNDYSLMPTAKYKGELKVPGSGKRWIEHLDGRKVAEACKMMGAGRLKKGDPINMAVGVVLNGKVGSAFDGGDTVCIVHSDSKEQFESIKDHLAAAFTYSEKPVATPSLIKARIV